MPYLKGYRLRSSTGRVVDIRKHDFSGDTKHTYNAYQSMYAAVLNLCESDEFPVEIMDLDKMSSQEIGVAEDLKYWLTHKKA